ncbi:MAG: hypothetical protein WC788_07620 [Candidatus Paceibacterota bacterium]|jgi:galactose mutarotase-like enzyme
MKERIQFDETNEKELKIETISSPEGHEISFCPEKGGIITSIKIRGVEILRADPKDFKEAKTRGGIPVMFPNAGALDGPLVDPSEPEKKLETLKPHGFARDSKWEIEKVSQDELIETLSEEKPDSYPYEYLLKMIARIEKDGSITLAQEVRNDSGKEMPVSMGLHPYFKVPKGRKKDVLIDLGDEKMNGKIRDNFEKWSKGEAMIVDRSELEDPDSVLRIEIPEIGTIAMDVFEKYQNIWIWSEESKEDDEDDFICIEPVMRKPKGLAQSPEMVKPGETFKTGVRIGLEG